MTTPRHWIGEIARGLADRWVPQPPPPPAPPPPPPEQAFLKRCLSVEGEDLVLDCFLRRARFGIYVDVGAHHPIRFSNTFLLYEQGWRGINIDPNPESIEAFKMFRPDDINVTAAVSDQETPVLLHRSMSTIDSEWAGRVAKTEVSPERLEVHPRRLSDILDEHLLPGQQIDLLNIDVEATEIGVLKSIAWQRHRPGLIAVGIMKCLTVDQLLKSEVGCLLRDQRYELLARTYSTAFFGDPEYMRQWFADDLNLPISPVELTRRRIEQARPRRIILGSGGVRYHGWIDTDVDVLDITDPEQWRAIFGDLRAETLLAEHVFEHIDCDAHQGALELCFAYLVPGGRLRIAVPDGYRTDEHYLEQNAAPTDGHTVFFNCDTLGRLLAGVGFEVTRLEWFDQEGHFRAKPWDRSEGIIRRSIRFDRQAAFQREIDGREIFYTSLIVDAVRPPSGNLKQHAT